MLRCGCVDEAVRSGFGRDGLRLLVGYLLAMNVVTFALFVIDKRRAQEHKWRIRESTLLGLSLAGGCVGGYAAMRLAHHKTRVARFRYGLPVMIVLDAAIVAWLLWAGIVR